MKILILEDEPIIARRIKRMVLALLGEKITQLESRHSLAEGFAYLQKETIDLLFLDLNLNGADGFDLLQSLVAGSFHTIIISAYKEKAITAFQYGVLDFVPKPFNEARLSQALSRLSSTENIAGQARYLAIQKRGKLVLLDIGQVAYIQGAGIYSDVIFEEGRKEVHNKNLDKLSQLLPPHFDRIHKSYIVNSRMIKELDAQAGGKYTVHLKNGNQLPVSRSRYKGLKEKWMI